MRMSKFCIFASVGQASSQNRNALIKYLQRALVLFFVIARGKISRMGDSLTFLSGMSLDEQFMLYLDYKWASSSFSPC